MCIGNISTLPCQYKIIMNFRSPGNCWRQDFNEGPCSATGPTRRLSSIHPNAIRYRLPIAVAIVSAMTNSIPIGLLAMALLGFPFVIGSVRHVSAGQRAAIGGSVGILFYLVEQMTGHVALLYELNPIPAAMGPDAALLVVALASLYRNR